MNIPLKDFYFIRHGKTDWNKKHLAMGQTDIPLNETGLKQATQAAESLKDISFGAIVSSPLMRAKKTAEIIAQTKSLDITIIDELKECSWGIMEGQPIASGSWINNWRNGANIENAESFLSFEKRIINALSEALKLPEPVLIIAHDGVYRTIQKALKLPFLDLANCDPIYHRAPQISNHPWLIYKLNDYP